MMASFDTLKVRGAETTHCHALAALAAVLTVSSGGKRIIRELFRAVRGGVVYRLTKALTNSDIGNLVRGTSAGAVALAVLFPAALAHAESFSASITLPAQLARSSFKLDPKIDAILAKQPLHLVRDQQAHMIVEMANLTDPSSASYSSWHGALYLQEPAHVGRLRAYFYTDRSGRALRLPSGRVAKYYWYEMPDGRIARYVTAPDGRAVGTYLLDRVSGAYEFAVDVDGDRRVDLLDATFPAGRERIVMTELGREMAALWNRGMNPLCFDALAGGLIAGDFGSGADVRAGLPGCGLRHGGGAGGATGSLGSPTDPNAVSTPLDELCDDIAANRSKPLEWLDPSNVNREEDFEECNADCFNDQVVCVGMCTAAAVGADTRGWRPVWGYLLCVGSCYYAAWDCEVDCSEEADAADAAAAAAEAAMPPTEPATSPSRYADTDGDGTYDSEDTDADGEVDSSCSQPNCGVADSTVRGRPAPDDYRGGMMLLCKERNSSSYPRGWGSFDPSPDCPDPVEIAAKSNEKTGSNLPDVNEASCYKVEKAGVDDAITVAASVGCSSGIDGVCDDVLGQMRARMLEAAGAAVIGVQIVCDPIVCQPALAAEANH